METILAITPGHSLDPQIAIAAAKSGELGILDLGLRNDASAVTAALDRLGNTAGAAGRWGVRWDTLRAASRGLGRLAEFLQSRPALVVLAGLKIHEMAKLRQAVNCSGRQVFLEVHDRESALAAQAAGFDGLIVKGHEAGGRVGKSSSFILLQELQQIKIPYWIQ